MPYPPTYQSQMAVYRGVAPQVDQNGQIANISYLVNVVAVPGGTYTVNAKQSGTVFTTTGATQATTFTLPAVSNTGVVFSFVNTVDQNMTVASAEGDNIVFLNDAEVDSLSFSTSSEKIGGSLTVVSDGTKWLVFVGADEAQTITPAT